ncbi:MAG: hypothetical protein AAGF75_02100 [Cyanobacteria bacterium P01_H01_bin.130]
MTQFTLEEVFPGATQDGDTVTFQKSSLPTLADLDVNSAEGILAGILLGAKAFYTPARRENNPDIPLEVADPTVTMENQVVEENGQFALKPKRLAWTFGMKFTNPTTTPEFNAAILDGGTAPDPGGGVPAPGNVFGTLDFRWQLLISDAINATGRRYVWIAESVPTLTLPAEEDGDGWVIANHSDTDTAIAGTDVVIPPQTSAYLIFSGDTWQHLLLSPPAPPPPPPPEPERLTFQQITETNGAISPDDSRHIWITEPIPSLTLPPSQPGDGFLVVNDSDTDSEVPGENPGDPAITLPSQTTTLLIRTAQGWSYQVIGGSSGDSSGGSPGGSGGSAPDATIDISGSNFAVSLDPDLLFSFGTNFGAAAWSNPFDGFRCDIQASSLQFSDRPASRLGDRTTNYFASDNIPGSWVAIDFDPVGTGHRVNLDAFAWQHIPDFADLRIQSLLIEAGEGADLASATWTQIGSIADPNFLPNSPGSWSSVRSLTPQPSPYRFVRFTMSGPPAGGTNYMLGSELVLGGDIHLGST